LQVGHMVEPFVEIDYLSKKERVILDGATCAVGSYDRVAYVRSEY
jgi:hypothetical protein